MPVCIETYYWQGSLGLRLCAIVRSVAEFIASCDGGGKNSVLVMLLYTMWALKDLCFRVTVVFEWKFVVERGLILGYFY